MKTNVVNRSPFGSLTVSALFLGAALSLVGTEPDDARRLVSEAGVNGGVIVHLGCGDGRATAALRINDRFLVLGLDASPDRVAEARRRLQSLKLYGPISVDQWSGPRLPCTDNFVNLLIVESDAAVSPEEVDRALVPGGTAWIRTADQWQKTVKPRSGEMDEWTHYLHGPDNNAVSHDSLVGPPRHLQWVSGPRWSRHHDHMSSVSAVVSASGRIFTILDEGSAASIFLPSQWSLVARDAFNGTLLWKRPIAEWNTQLWPLKSGPNQLPRRLVAAGERVYVTLGIDAPVSVLDAPTGETVRTCPRTEHTDEMVLDAGVLFLLVGQEPNRWKNFRPKASYVWDNTTRANQEWAWDQSERQVMALEPETGRSLWQSKQKVAPLTLAVDQERVYLHNGQEVVALNRNNGEQVWTSQPIQRRSYFPTGYGPTLVVRQGVVLVSVESASMTALDSATGQKLWSADHHRGGHASPDDLLVINSLVWSGAVAASKDSGLFTGRNLQTGEVEAEFPPDVDPYWFHHRCYRSKATDRFILTSRTGIEFVDLKARTWDINHWVRGACLYGILPGNGLVYAPPSPCACYLESKLNGFNALAPASQSRAVPEPPPADARLERGPAYGQASHSQLAADSQDNWPTYRHDPARSGATKAAVPTTLKRAWETALEIKLTSPVVAEGRIFVAAVDTHTLHALDLESGEQLWSFTAGARIDSPPTIDHGLALFGCADGWIYGLRAADGQLAWRFRAAPQDRRIQSCDQLESAWPVSGSVLVQDGVLSCVAGRSMFLDGGLRLLRLNPQTGNLLSETVLDHRHPGTGQDLQQSIKGLDMPVALPDILSSDGRELFMRALRFTLDGHPLNVEPENVNEQAGAGAHLFSRSGFLDDSWWHRSYWLFGRNVSSGWGGWFRPGRHVPAGRLLVFDENTVWGFGRRPEYMVNGSVQEYYLFAARKALSDEPIQNVLRAARRMDASSPKSNASSADWALRKTYPLTQLGAAHYQWAQGSPPFQARAMILADKTLFLAGPPDLLDEEAAYRDPDDPAIREQAQAQADALQGRSGAQLWVINAADGVKKAAYALDHLPVFDGLAAVDGRLVMATTPGRVLCLASAGAPLRKLGHPDLPSLDTTAQAIPPDPPLAEADGDFSVLRGSRAFRSDLGYLVVGQQKQIGFALQKLAAPLAGGRTTFRVKLRPGAGDQAGAPLKNGFLVFGHAPNDASLVKCGMRFLMGSAVIVQGPMDGGKTASAPCPADLAQAHELTVVLDPDTRKISLMAGQTKLEADLERVPAPISYIGYAVLDAAAEFGPVEVTSSPPQ